ncbi:hypothetical protein BDV19DRAFT_367184 [Aspergillus venezuelensis]
MTRSSLLFSCPLGHNRLLHLAMASPFQSTDWMFITTSPSRRKPTSAQRSQIRQRVMREIGYARRRVPRSQQTSQECASGMPYLSFCHYLSSSLTTQALLPSFIIDPLTLDAESRWLLQHSEQPLSSGSDPY